MRRLFYIVFGNFLLHITVTDIFLAFFFNIYTKITYEDERFKTHKKFQRITENSNISDVIESIFSLFEGRFNELNEIKKKNKDKWDHYELNKHRAKEQELSLLYRRIKEKYSL